MTAPAPARDTTGTQGPELLHIVCTCQEDKQDPQLALCGTDTTGQAVYNRGLKVQDCVVCIDAVRTGTPCPGCGSRVIAP